MLPAVRNHNVLGSYPCCIKCTVPDMEKVFPVNVGLIWTAALWFACLIQLKPEHGWMFALHKVSNWSHLLKVAQGPKSEGITGYFPIPQDSFHMYWGVSAMQNKTILEDWLGCNHLRSKSHFSEAISYSEEPAMTSHWSETKLEFPIKAEILGPCPVLLFPTHFLLLAPSSWCSRHPFFLPAPLYHSDAHSVGPTSVPPVSPRSWWDVHLFRLHPDLLAGGSAQESEL